MKTDVPAGALYVRSASWCFEKMMSLILFQAIASVTLIDKPPHRTVAAKDVFQVLRLENKGIRLRGEKGSPRRKQRGEHNYGTQTS